MSVSKKSVSICLAITKICKKLKKVSGKLEVWLKAYVFEDAFDFVIPEHLK